MKSMVLLFIVVVHFATGEALKCWECYSMRDGPCGELFDKSDKDVMEEKCKQGENSCAIHVFLKNPYKLTERGCQKSHHTSADTNSSVKNGDEDIEFCSTDLCNGAKSVSVNNGTQSVSENNGTNSVSENNGTKSVSENNGTKSID